MKKFFFIALCAFCLADAAQAQHLVNSNPNGAVVNNEVISATAFRQKTGALKTALNANDFAQAQTLWYPVCRAMYLKGDQLKRQHNDAGAETRYQLSSKIKTLSQDLQTNKPAMLQLLADMDTAY